MRNAADVDSCERIIRCCEYPDWLFACRLVLTQRILLLLIVAKDHSSEITPFVQKRINNQCTHYKSINIPSSKPISMLMCCGLRCMYVTTSCIVVKLYIMMKPIPNECMLSWVWMRIPYNGTIIAFPCLILVVMLCLDVILFIRSWDLISFLTAAWMCGLLYCTVYCVWCYWDRSINSPKDDILVSQRNIRLGSLLLENGMRSLHTHFGKWMGTLVYISKANKEKLQRMIIHTTKDPSGIELSCHDEDNENNWTMKHYIVDNKVECMNIHNHISSLWHLPKYRSWWWMIMLMTIALFICGWAWMVVRIRKEDCHWLAW